jgi:hypothetical protein
MEERTRTHYVVSHIFWVRSRRTCFRARAHVSSRFAIAAVISILSIYLSLKGMPKDPVKLRQTGFATVRGNNLLDFSTSVLGRVLLANIPQALLSYLYIAFNGLYTSMFVPREWHNYRYIHERKPLRVTSPVRLQRDT